MTTHELLQFMWGKWLVSDSERKRLKESGYGIIGSSPNLSAESLYPDDILIGRPFLEVYDINSYTLTEARDHENLLWSLFYYKVNDIHWSQWKGESAGASNRPFVMEHHAVIPKALFYRLRFNIPQIISSIDIPQLNIVYFSNHQELGNIVVELPSDDQISGRLRESLNLLSTKKKDALLLLEILNNFSITRECLTVVNCNMNTAERLNLLLNALILLPDKDAVEFRFCTSSYIKAKPTLFNVMILESDVKVSTSRQVDFLRLVWKENNIPNGYGTLLLNMISDLGVELTARLMSLSTHQLSDKLPNNGFEKLKSLYFEISAQQRLDDGIGWSLEDLLGYMKKNRDQGAKKYRRHIEDLFQNNISAFTTLLKEFPKEIIENGFREFAFHVLANLSLRDLKIVFINASLAGSLSSKELFLLSKWIGEKFSGNMHKHLDVLVASEVINLEEKDELIRLLLKNKFDADVFMSELDRFIQAENLPSINSYIHSKDIEAVFIAKAYSYLTNNVNIAPDELKENLQYIKTHVEWFHKLVILSLQHGKYDFLSDQLLGTIYQNYWSTHESAWKQIVFFGEKLNNPTQLLPLLSLIFLTDGLIENDITKIFDADLASSVTHLCQSAEYLTPKVDLKPRFWRAFRDLGSKNKSKDIKLWLSKLLIMPSLFGTGKYLLESYLMSINDEADFIKAIELCELFKKNNHDLNEVAKIYLIYLPKNLNKANLDDKTRWFLLVLEKLIKNFSVSKSIYSQLAIRLDELHDKDLNDFQFHESILSQLDEEYKNEYL